jgi:signal transduction histidine kinase/DNA-binding response OmpR family regulator
MKPHILLIDDSETIQAAIAGVLSKSDYLLTTASSGAEGLSCLQQQKCDLILLDYSLPDIDGLRLLEQILTEKPDIPVIIVTGSGSERIAVDALKTGAADYVIKTNDFIAELPHVIRDNLEKHEMKRRNRELESQLRASYKELKRLNRELEETVQARTEELERAYQLSNELMAKAVDSNMQLAELYGEVDESRRKLDAKIRELSLLNEAGKLMAATLDKDTLLQVAIDSAHQELGVEHCAILLLNEETYRLQIGASRGGTPDDLLLAARSLNGEKVLLNIIREGTPLLIQDIEAHERFGALAQEYSGIECFMIVPLRVKNLEIGVFTIYGYEDSKTFTKDELEFVSALASQASIALANIILTNRRLHEEQLSMIGRMTGYFMHELNPAFEAIRTCAESIGNDELDPARKKDSAQIILQEIERISGMTQELLEFSQGQRGMLHLQTVSVKDFIQDVLASIERNFTNQHIAIHANLQYTGPFTVDVAKMKRAFINIADNARSAMSEGGSLTITARLQNDAILFEFVDEGREISPDLQAHLFEPFVIGEKFYSTGLDMTIVKKILDEHHAQISVQSVIAKGTTIRIALPRVQRSWEGDKVTEKPQRIS